MMDYSSLRLGNVADWCFHSAMIEYSEMGLFHYSSYYFFFILSVSKLILIFNHISGLNLSVCPGISRNNGSVSGKSDIMLCEKYSEAQRILEALPLKLC